VSAAPLVLHVIAGLGIGGAERMLAALTTAPRRAPHRQAVIDLLAGGALGAEIRAAGVPVHEIGLEGPLGVPRAIARTARLIRALAPDCVQTWMYYADLIGLWALERSGRRAATRLYWGIRCSDMDQSRYGSALRWTIAACARRAARPDAVVANSFAGRDAHRRLGYRPRAFAVIPNGIDTARFRPDPEARRRVRGELGIPERAFVALHAARIDPMKDHATLAALAGLRPDLLFLAVGKGTEALAGAPNLRGLGIRVDMPALYAAADAVLSTSAFGEGFSNVLAEGMAAGLPAVATHVGDARAIAGEAGAVAPPRDPAALAAALDRIAAAAPAERAARAAAARAHIEARFSLARCVAAFDALHLHGALPEDPFRGDAETAQGRVSEPPASVRHRQGRAG
jgi:glycosyltransferase involved in cell wall biosynthesis